MLPSSGSMSLSLLATEFGKVLPLSMSQLYAVTSGIPASGVMSLSAFYGKSASAYSAVSGTMTIGSQYTASDGKYVTDPNTGYGKSTGAYGSCTILSYRGYTTIDIVYTVYSSGRKQLIVNMYNGAQAASVVLPIDFLKRISFAGNYIAMPTAPVVENSLVLLWSWAPLAVGVHRSSYQDTSTGKWSNYIGYVIDVTAAPFALSGTVAVSMEY